MGRKRRSGRPKSRNDPLRQGTPLGHTPVEAMLPAAGKDVHVASGVDQHIERHATAAELLRSRDPASFVSPEDLKAFSESLMALLSAEAK